MWWSGLSLADAKFGIAGLGPNLKNASVDGLNYWYLENGDYSRKKISALLPAYDEFMVGYSEGRSIAFPPGLDKSVLGNGIFKPIVLSKNTLVGTWKKISQEPFVEVQFLQGNGKDKGINSSVKTFQLFSQKLKK
jgi:hypothetical protein